MSASRRDFLKSVAGISSALSFTSAIPDVLAKACLAAPPGHMNDDNDRVLVVLQLSGGNDGLNMIVPYADDAYARRRKTLRLTKQDVLTIDDYQGFHPQLTGLRQLMDEGHLAVVHGVGYANNDRGHEQAMREWHTGRPGEFHAPTGWIGRAADAAGQAHSVAVPTAFVGPIAQPFALRAKASVVPAIRQLDDLTLPGGRETSPWAESDAASTASDNPLLDVVRRGTTAARTLSERVDTVRSRAPSEPEYPSFGLADRLRTVSQLIQADLGAKIYCVELGGGGIGGFDNHANQRDNHAALLREMSESLVAFVRDLQRHGLLSRVVLMTFSEFGRTVTENGRHGTGHGAAAPLLLVGGRLRSGMIGPHPSLTDLDQDALKPQIDYRRVYATLLQGWLGHDAQRVLGARFEPLNVLG